MRLIEFKKIIPVSLTILAVTFLLLGIFSARSSAQTALPTDLTAQQKSLLEQRKAADEAKRAQDEADLVAAQATDSIEADTMCDTSYAGKFQAGQGGGGTSGGSGSPVFEIGSLLEITSNILGNIEGIGKTLEKVETVTGQTRDLTQKVCDYLKAIERIDRHFEDQAFIYDPAARRTAASNVEEYKFQVLNLVKKGRAGLGPNGETESKLFPENTQEYIDGAVREQVMVQLDNLQKIAEANPDDPNIKATINSLRYAESQNLESRLKSPITQEKIDQAFDSNSDMSAQESDIVFLNVFNPESNANPYTQLLTANAALQQAKYNAEQNAREELLAGGGYLNNRECAETTSGTGADGVLYCRRWVTITPGSTISGGTLAALNTRLSQYEQADTQGKLTEYIPSVNELNNLSPEGDNSVGGYGPFDDYDGDGTPNWQDTDKDNDNVPDDRDPTPYLDDGAILPLPMTFTYSTPATTTGSTFLTSTLSWEAGSSTTCLADNNWLSADQTTTGVIKAVRTAGEELPESGSVKVYLPTNFVAKLIRIRGSAGTEYAMATTTDSSGLGLLATLSVPSGAGEVASGDKFQLSFKPFTGASTVEVTVPATSPSSATVVNLFKTALAGKLKNYTFGYQTTAGKLTALAQPFYQISCADEVGTTTKKLLIRK